MIQLLEAISSEESALLGLESSGWFVQCSDKAIDLFRYLKKGALRKTPTFLLFFNEANTVLKWSVSDARIRCSFSNPHTALRFLLELAAVFDAESLDAARELLGNKSRSSPSAKLGNDRLADRDIDELIGICKGILSGGFVVYEQANSLLRWFNHHPTAATIYPGKPLYHKLSVMLQGNTLGVDDELELLGFFMKLGGSASEQVSTALPLTLPPPRLFFKNRQISITGKFKLGNRDFMVDFIERLGAVVSRKGVTQETDYLLIGNIGSDHWIHSTHGRKIEYAVALIERGHKLAIISEDHFMTRNAVMVNIAIRRLLR